MEKVYGDDCLAHSKVLKKSSFKRFEIGHEYLYGTKRPGGPNESNRTELMEKVRGIIAFA